MKYRVKKIEWEDTTWYYPQRKGRFFWKNYYRDNASSCDEYASPKFFDTEEKAWEYIRNHKPWPVITYTYANDPT